MLPIPDAALPQVMDREHFVCQEAEKVFHENYNRLAAENLSGFTLDGVLV
jgi:hypothetical protein